MKNKFDVKRVTIVPPNFDHATFLLTGVTPLLINNWGMADPYGYMPKPNPRSAKDRLAFCKYVDRDGGWDGVPCTAFRSGMIDACRLAGLMMSMAKLSLFVESDGTDIRSGKPIVRLLNTRGVEQRCKISCGKDQMYRSRCLYDKGWQINLRVKWDADQFQLGDVTNLLMRTGQQIGIGEGRPYSRHSAATGYGTFECKSVTVGVTVQTGKAA
jgi:hypothetical protein